VPLLQFAKAVYTNNETFEASIDVSNYGQEVLKNQGISWFLKDGGKIIEQGHFQSTIGKGHQGHVGHLEVPLQAIGQAKKLTIQLKLEGTSYENHWNIWGRELYARSGGSDALAERWEKGAFKSRLEENKRY